MAKFHGVFSIGLFFITQVIAMTAMFLESQLLGLGYAILFMAASLAIVYFYCTKCPLRLTGCKHVIIGPVTQAFPERKQGSYNRTDYLAVVISLMIMILLPQIVLWKHRGLLIIFWVILVAAGIEINRFVCRDCGNVNCIACRKKPPAN